MYVTEWLAIDIAWRQSSDFDLNLTEYLMKLQNATLSNENHRNSNTAINRNKHVVLSV